MVESGGIAGTRRKRGQRVSPHSPHDGTTRHLDLVGDRESSTSDDQCRSQTGTLTHTISTRPDLTRWFSTATLPCDGLLVEWGEGIGECDLATPAKRSDHETTIRPIALRMAA